MAARGSFGNVKRSISLLLLLVGFFVFGDIGCLAAKKRIKSCAPPNESNSEHSDVIWLYATKAFAAQDYERAVACFKDYLKLKPTVAVAAFNLGASLASMKNYKAAEVVYRKAFEMESNGATTTEYAHFGHVLFELGKKKEALDTLVKAIKLGSTAEVDYERALNITATLASEGEPADELEFYLLEELVKIAPSRYQAWSSLAMKYVWLDDYSNALRAYRGAFSSVSDYTKETNATRVITDAHNAAAMANMIGKWRESLDYLVVAVNFNSTQKETYYNLGLTLMRQRRTSEAISYAERAVSLDPKYYKAVFLIGYAYIELRREDKQREFFERAFNLASESGDPTIMLESMMPLLHTKLNLCQWEGIDKDMRYLQNEVLPKVLHAIEKGENDSSSISLSPLQALRLGFSEEMTYKIAKLGVSVEQQNLRNLTAGSMPFKYPPLIIQTRMKENPSRRIKLGYLSYDFREHPTYHLIASLFDYHNTKRFEVSIFDTHGPCKEIDSVKGVVENYYDVSSFDDDEMASFIHDKELDILVDLDGFTQGGRAIVVAAGAAPIQISYMGYLGTSLQDTVQYFVADRHVLALPDTILQMKEHEKQQEAIDKFLKNRFAEKIIFMPDTLYIASYRKLYSEALTLEIPREMMKLPIKTSLGDQFVQTCPNAELLNSDTTVRKTSFVFCNFNAAFKWDATIFNAWLRILKRVPDSVFMIGSDLPVVEMMLMNRAVGAGVSPKRLIFSPRLAKVEHLARLKYCDMWLDSPTRYGSHTLAVDVLWAGLPLLTFGHSLVTRVASSVLHASGVTETIAKDLDHYEQLAVYYATKGQPALRRIRKRLEAARNTAPLFDAELWTRNWEKALRKIVLLHADRKSVV